MLLLANHYLQIRHCDYLWFIVLHSLVVYSWSLWSLIVSQHYICHPDEWHSAHKHDNLGKFVPYVLHYCYLSKSMSSEPPAFSHQMSCHIYQSLWTSVNAVIWVHDGSSLIHVVTLPNPQCWHISLPNSPQITQIENSWHTVGPSCLDYCWLLTLHSWQLRCWIYLWNSSPFQQ